MDHINQTPLDVTTHPDVESTFDSFPNNIRIKLLELRELIISVARSLPEINKIEETLKWGEISYKSKYGSTIRMNWKPKSSVYYGLFFQCTSKLVPTFRSLFKAELNFENNRAILLNIEEKLPEEILKKCIKAALLYHKVKTTPNLGIETD